MRNSRKDPKTWRAARWAGRSLMRLVELSFGLVVAIIANPKVAVLLVGIALIWGFATGQVWAVSFVAGMMYVVVPVVLLIIVWKGVFSRR